MDTDCDEEREWEDEDSGTDSRAARERRRLAPYGGDIDGDNGGDFTEDEVSAGASPAL